MSALQPVLVLDPPFAGMFKCVTKPLRLKYLQSLSAQIQRFATSAKHMLIIKKQNKWQHNNYMKDTLMLSGSPNITPLLKNIPAQLKSILENSHYKPLPPKTNTIHLHCFMHYFFSILIHLVHLNIFYFPFPSFC